MASLVFWDSLPPSHVCSWLTNKTSRGCGAAAATDTYLLSPSSPSIPPALEALETQLLGIYTNGLIQLDNMKDLRDHLV